MARRAGSGSDDRADAEGFDEIADALYTLPPSEFTAARDTRAARARRDGDRSLATRIKALRRPTLAAWASNALVRARPDDVRDLLGLGEELRRAHRDLDGTRLRALSARHRTLTTDLARQAAALAGKTGQPLSEQAMQEVRSTLQAAFADPEAAATWASGRLAHPLSPPAFPSAATGTAAPAAESGSGTRRRAGSAPKPTPAQPTQPAQPAESTDAEQARARREARDRAAAARRGAEEAAAAVAAAEAALEQTRSHSHDARTRKQQAHEHLAELRREVAEAEQAEHAAAEDEQRARDRAEEAERGLADARRHARKAAAHADRLADRADGGRTGTAGTAGRAPTEDRTRGRRSRGRR
ncbi:hypothetical protein ACFZBU_11320 [Embleya sp. NPDC008237]|uniref:hypothetical protein n=1 Tax=Embleya sp. NPDC008237 TaxID=3363978 RepID=UPI0036E70C40